METKLAESLLEFKETLAGLKILQTAVSNEGDTIDMRDLDKVLKIYIDKLHKSINTLADITDDVITKYAEKQNYLPNLEKV